MSLRLHQLLHSPFCLPVTRFLEAHGIAYESNEISPWDRREVIRLTGGAYYQVPVIEHDGKVVHETPGDPLAVPHYLDAAFAGGRLFPDHCAGLHEIVIAQIENELEGKAFMLSDPGVCDRIEDLEERVMVIRHKERRFGGGCVERWRANAGTLLADLEALLEPYETRLGHSPWLFGEDPVYADYALFGVLGNFQYGGFHRLDPRFENLHRWEAALRRQSPA